MPGTPVTPSAPAVAGGAAAAGEKRQPMARPAGAGAKARPGKHEAPRRHQTAAETVYHGRRACEALFAHRPDAIVRVYVAEASRTAFAAITAWCAARRKGFQIVPADSVARVAGSLHHEGIAILARTREPLDADGLLAASAAGTITGPLVYLDGVQNPHNLGTILRTAAYLGAGAVVGRAGELPAVSPAAARVAEGAAEIVPVVACADPVADFTRLRAAGFTIVGTSSHRGDPLRARPLPPRTVFVLGSEGTGMSPEVEKAIDRCVRIPGSDAVESLNVAVACGILLAEWAANHGTAAAGPPATGRSGPARRRP